MTRDGQRVLLAGSGFQSEPTDWDLQTVALDSSTGTVTWKSRYGGPAGLTDWGKENVVSPDGSTVYTLGLSEGDGTGDDLVIVAHETATGKLQWSARHDGSGHQNDGAIAVDVSPITGQVFATGTLLPESGDYNFTTFSYSADGALLWLEEFGDPGDGEDVWWLAANPALPAVYVTGRDNRPYSTIYVTIAYRA